MKKLLVLFVVLVFAVSAVLADVYIKEKFHRDGYYHGGVNNPAEDRESEIWLAEDKAASIGSSRKIVLDQGQKKIYFIDMIARTYVEAPLPLDASAILDEQLKGILQTIEIKLEIKEMGKSRKIDNRNCKGYTMNQWIMLGEQRTGDVESTVWATTDVSFPLDLYEQLFESLLHLTSRDDSLIQESRKVKGLLVESENVRWQEGLAIKTSRRVTEIAQKNSPAGTYGIPEGFTKNEKLSLQNLQNLLNR
jgi:hypothetical protein